MLVHVPSSQFRILLISCSVIPGWVCGSPATAAVPVPPSAQSQSQAVENYGKLPIGFEANQGQADPSVKFLSRGSGYAIFLTGDGAVLDLGQSGRKPADCSPSASGKKLQNTTHATSCSATSTDGRDVIRMTLAGSPGQARVAHASGEDPLPGKVNYFFGNDPTRWRTDLPTYARVRYSSVYPGVDLVYYGNQRQLEYDFVVAPGARTEPIRLQFAGARHVQIAANGDLVLEGAHGKAIFQKPVIYQEEAGSRQPVNGKFYKASRNSVGFSVANYDRNRALIIDPILVYSTYLGGTGSIAYLYNYGDQGNGIAADKDGNAYIVGSATSANFPVTPGAYQTKNKAASPALTDSAPNVFVSKFNSTGTALIYSTYLGGSGDEGGGLVGILPVGGDSGLAIALDAENNAYMTGVTTSQDFPVTTGAFQTVEPTGISVFVTKLNAKGDGLVYSTYLGGSNVGVGSSIAVDASGDAYVTGYTHATDFPVTAGAFQTQYPGTGIGDTPSAFVSELNPNGTNLVYSTYLGGTGVGVLVYGVTFTYTTYYGDSANGIALDDLGNAYVTGQTYSADFPVTSGAFQMVNHGFASQNPNAFITKLNSTGTAEVYSSYLGGSGHTYVLYSNEFPGDSANAISISGDGSAYVAGVTGSTDFPISGGLLQTLSPGGQTGFVAKLNTAGSALDYSTYLGGDYAQANGLAVDSSGVAYLSGFAPYFPETPDALTQNGGVFVAKLNALGTALDYATSLGGDPGSGPIPLALDSTGNVYITGRDYSSGYLISSGAYQTVNKSSGPYGTNAFVTKLALAGETADHFPVTMSISASPASVNQGQPVTLSAKVTGPNGVPTPTGQVTFFEYFIHYPVPGLPVTETLDGNGVATWTTSTLQPGAYQDILASYAGDGSHLTGQMVSPFNSAGFRVIGPPANFSYPGCYRGQYCASHYPICTYGACSNLGLSAEVTDSAGFGLQGVTVNFSGIGLGFTTASAVTNANGIATVYFTPLQAGSLVVTASVTGIETPLAILITVLPVPLTVLTGAPERYYGTPNPTLVSRVFGLIGSDTVTVNLQTTATQASPVGNYPVTATLSGPDAVNYSPTIQEGFLKVVKGPLNVQARNVVSYYGQTPPPITAYFVEGFVNGDTISVVSGSPVLTTTVTSHTDAGFYKIGVDVSQMSAANYYFNPFGSGEGSVEVIKAPLTVTANNQTMPRGGPVPPLTYILSGFVNGQDATTAGITGAPLLTTPATSASRPGIYPIYVSNGTFNAKNYWASGVTGVLTITP